MEEIKRIAILITCYNRKEKTISCLNSLYLNHLPKNMIFSVFLVDDGSSDNTGEIVLSKYPEINLIVGSGNLFWNRGMNLAWLTANKIADYDYYMWLNDDTVLFPNCLDLLLNTSGKYSDRSILVGSTCSGYDNKITTYGGRSKKYGLIIPTVEEQLCDFFNGNIVLIPKWVFKLVGFNDPIFHHALGDFDYGLRAANKGVTTYIAPGYLGICDLHQDLPAWCNPKTNIFRRFKLLYSALGNHPIEFFIYERRHNGLIKACYHFLTNHFRAIIPSLWLR
jgi:GT2 family glycosyltransferase